jgi:hypothetical protein
MSYMIYKQNILYNIQIDQIQTHNIWRTSSKRTTKIHTFNPLNLKTYPTENIQPKHISQNLSVYQEDPVKVKDG